MKVDWALSGPVPWEAPEVREAGTVHVGGDEGELLDALALGADDSVAERPFLLFGQQTVADPTRAPDGQHTAWAYTHGPHGVDWEAETPRMAERMEEQVERYAPGFRDRILARHVLSPADLERRDANLVGGDVGAGSYSLDQMLFRPGALRLALPHPGPRALPGQRGDLPGRRRARRAGARGGARGAAREPRAASLSGVRPASRTASGSARRSRSPRPAAGRASGRACAPSAPRHRSAR